MTCIWAWTWICLPPWNRSETLDLILWTQTLIIQGKSLDLLLLARPLSVIWCLDFGLRILDLFCFSVGCFWYWTSVSSPDLPCLLFITILPVFVYLLVLCSLDSITHSSPLTFSMSYFLWRSDSITRHTSPASCFLSLTNLATYFTLSFRKLSSESSLNQLIILTNQQTVGNSPVSRFYQNLHRFPTFLPQPSNLPLIVWRRR